MEYVIAITVAAMGGLQKGVETFIEKIQAELEQHMVLTGTASVKHVQKDILSRFR